MTSQIHSMTQWQFSYFKVNYICFFIHFISKNNFMTNIEYFIT